LGYFICIFNLQKTDMIFSIAIIIHNNLVIYKRSSAIIHYLNEISMNQNFIARPAQRGRSKKEEDPTPGSLELRTKLFLGLIVQLPVLVRAEYW